MEITGDRRDEVRVLADAFNRMLDRLSEAFASQREFVADASHELRTPLTVIRGQLEVLAAQRIRPATRCVGSSAWSLAEITRISRLVDDLLVLAQAERTDFLRAEPIDVRPFVTDLWDGVSLTADRRFELGEIADGSLYADPDRLAQALRNLARNAIEHTAEHDGLVRLDVTPLAADRIRFSVLDDGPGIPRHERERVFERFHRTDSGRSRSDRGRGSGARDRPRDRRGARRHSPRPRLPERPRRCRRVRFAQLSRQLTTRAQFGRLGTVTCALIRPGTRGHGRIAPDCAGGALEANRGHQPGPSIIARSRRSNERRRRHLLKVNSGLGVASGVSDLVRGTRGWALASVLAQLQERQRGACAGAKCSRVRQTHARGPLMLEAHRCRQRQPAD